MKGGEGDRAPIRSDLAVSFAVHAALAIALLFTIPESFRAESQQAISVGLVDASDVPVPPSVAERARSMVPDMRSEMEPREVGEEVVESAGRPESNPEPPAPEDPPLEERAEDRPDPVPEPPAPADSPPEEQAGASREDVGASDPIREMMEGEEELAASEEVRDGGGASERVEDRSEPVPEPPAPEDSPPEERAGASREDVGASDPIREMMGGEEKTAASEEARDGGGASERAEARPYPVPEPPAPEDPPLEERVGASDPIGEMIGREEALAVGEEVRDEGGAAERAGEKEGADLVEGRNENEDGKALSSAERKQGQALQNTVPSQDFIRMRRKIEGCWRIPESIRGRKDLVVRLEISLNRDGTLAGLPRPVDRRKDPLFLVAVEAAQRAIVRCQPYNFPNEEYKFWRRLIGSFDPSRAGRR